MRSFTTALLITLSLCASSVQAQTRVAAGANLQAALDAALPGDTLELDAGATFTGDYTLPVKNGTAPITVRTRGLTLPTGVIDQSANLATLRTPNSTPALRTVARTAHWRFDGIRFAAGATQSDIVALGDTSTADAALLPRDLVFDRSIFQADTAAKNGLSLNSADTTIRRSRFVGIKLSGIESHAIICTNGPPVHDRGQLHRSRQHRRHVRRSEAGRAQPRALGHRVPAQHRDAAGGPPNRDWLRHQEHLRAQERAARDRARQHLREQLAGRPGRLRHRDHGAGQQRDGAVDDDSARPLREQHRAAHGPRLQRAGARQPGAGGGPAGVPEHADGRRGDPQQPDLRYIDRWTWTSPTGQVASGVLLQIDGGPRNFHFENNTALSNGNIMAISGPPVPGFVFRRNIVQKVRMANPATGAMVETYGVFGTGAGEGNPAFATYFPHQDGYPDSCSPAT